MRLEVVVNSVERTILNESLRLQSQLGKQISTAEFIIEGGSVPSMGQVVAIDRGPAPFVNCAIIPAPAIGGAATYLDNYFGGYVAQIAVLQEGITPRYHIVVQDYNVRTTRKLVTESYVASTLKTIVDDLFSKYLPEFDTSEVENTVDTITIDWTRQKMNLCLDELANIFGKVWFIQHCKKVQFFTPAADTAPFILSDEPFGTSHIAYENIQHVEDGTDIVKTITVVGDGVVETRTKGDGDDADYEDKFVDNNIDTAAWAQEVGDAIIAEKGIAKVDGQLTCKQEGLVIGQKVAIKNDIRGVDAQYIIQSLSLSMEGPLQERVSVKYGDYSEDFVTMMARLKRLELQEA